MYTDALLPHLTAIYHVYMIMHVKDIKLSVVRVVHRVPLAGFCVFLSLYSLHVLNRDVNTIQAIKNLIPSGQLNNTRIMFCIKVFSSYNNIMLLIRFFF